MLKEHQLANIKEIENYSAVELGTTALKGAIESIDIDPALIEQVIFRKCLTKWYRTKFCTTNCY